jgi:FKBP-type peptidyl-prolyl cis-trans isomerase FklB
MHINTLDNYSYVFYKNVCNNLKNTKDSASYALGYRIAQSLKGQGLQDVNFELFKKGMAAGVISKTVIPDSLIDVCIKNYQDKIQS